MTNKIYLILVHLFLFTKSQAANYSHYYIKYCEIKCREKGELEISKINEERNFDVYKTRKMTQQDYNIVRALLLDYVIFIDSGFYGELHESSFRIGIEILNMFLVNGQDEIATNLLKELVDFVKARRHINPKNCKMNDFAWKYVWIQDQKWINEIDGEFRQKLMEMYPEVKESIEKLIPDNRPLNIVLAEKVTNLWNNWFHNKPANVEKSPLLIKEE